MRDPRRCCRHADHGGVLCLPAGGRILAVGLVSLAAVVAAPAAAQQRTFYGADGRVIGRAATDSQGTTTYYDPSGRVSARASGGSPERPGPTIWPGARPSTGSHGR